MGGGKEILIKQAKVFRRRVVKGDGGYLRVFIYSRKRERERQVRWGGRGVEIHF